MNEGSHSRRRRSAIAVAFSYPALLLALLASLVSESLFGERSASWMVPLLSLAILLGVILVVSSKPRTFRVALVLVLVPIGAVFYRWAQPESDLAVSIFFASLMGFYLLSALTILADVLRTGEVGFEKLVGAVCVYLLLGLSWSLSYAWLHHVDPSALALGGELDPTTADGSGRSDWSLATYHYFSFVTLTTLGFGDISPRSPDARTLAMLEAVVGQLFIAVLLARLVSLEVTQSARSGTPDDPTT